MNAFFISDTHCLHENLDMSFIEKDNVRAIFHCGDESSSYELAKNAGEALRFFSWAKSIKEKYNIPFYYIPGNHSVSVYNGLIDPSNWVDWLHEGISQIKIDGTIINIAASPIAPTYGQTKCYMKDRGEEISRYWKIFRESIEMFYPGQIDIFITHGPPYGILDLCQKRVGDIFYDDIYSVGCESLTELIAAIKPKIHAFGHIHNSKNVTNSGKIYNGDTLFINCAAESHFTRQLIEKPGHIINLKEFI